MSDQIIIEFIGDPSGLKPVEDALRGLGKSSQDTIAAFEKANTAAKHFAEGAKEAATAIKGTGDAAEKSVKSISSLSQAISGGAVKAVAEDFKNWAKEVAELAIKKGALKEQLTQVTASMAKAKEEIASNKAGLAALNKENSTTQKELNSTAKAIDEYNARSAKAAAQNIELKGKIEQARTALAAMNGTNEEGSTKYNKLATSIETWDTKVAKNEKTITDNAAKIHVLGETNRGLAEQYDTVRTKMEIAGTAADQSKSHYAELGKESKTLKGEIADVDKKLADANKTFGEQSKAAKESTESFSSLVGHTKKLVSALGEMAATTASATGSERDANSIRQKTAEVLQALTTAQTIATTATEAMTAATEIATVATTGLDVALSPVIAAVGAVAVVVGAAVAQFAVMYTVGKKVVEVVEEKFHVFEKVKPVIDAVGAALSKFADKARDVISFFSGGLIEDSKLHKLNDSLEKAAKESEKMSAEYKKQADLLEAEGMSAQSIAQRRAEALKEEQNALIDHLKVEKDATKQAELRDQISKNTVEILGQQKSVIEGMASDMQKQGKTEGEIYQAKEDQIRASIALIAQERLRKDLTDEQNKSLEAQARLMTNMLKETMEEHKKYDADQAKEAYARALESAKKTADLRLSVAKEGSDKELQARLDVMKADSALELNNTKLTRTQVELIKLKLAQDTAREIQAFYQKALAEAEKDEKKSDQEKYDARMAILNRERAAIANNDKLSAAQKIELFKQVNAQEDAAWKQLNDSLTQKEKQAATARLAAAQAEARKKLDIALQVSENEYKAGITAEEKILSDRKEKYEADLSNAKLSIKARMDLGEQYYSSVEASLQKEMQLLNKKYASDIAAAQKDEQAMEKLQDQYLKDSKAIEDKITVNKKEQANKRKEYAKEQGK